MSKPAVLIADGDRESLNAVETAMRRRYGQDYLIASETSAAALRVLLDLRNAGRPVALVVAAASAHRQGAPPQRA